MPQSVYISEAKLFNTIFSACAPVTMCAPMHASKKPTKLVDLHAKDNQNQSVFITNSLDC